MNKTLTAARSPSTLLSTLESLNRSQNYTAMVEMFDETVTPQNRRDRRRDGRALFLMGSALLRAGRKEDALYCFESALALDPGNVWVMAELGDLLAGRAPQHGELYYRHALFRDQSDRMLARAAAFAAQIQSRSLYNDLRRLGADRSDPYFEAWVEAAASLVDMELLQEMYNDRRRQGFAGLRVPVLYALASTKTDAKDFWDDFYAIGSKELLDRQSGRLNEFFIADRNFRLELEVLLQDLEIGRGTLIDSGCGIGVVANALARTFATVKAVDFSATGLAAAAALKDLQPNVEFFEADIVDWMEQTPPQSADVILDLFTSSAIEPNRTVALFRNYARQLAPDGVVIVAVNEKAPQKNMSFHSRFNLFGPDETETQLKDAGYSVEPFSYKGGTFLVARIKR